MPFDTATRRKLIPLAPLTKPVGGGLVQVQLPRTGMLARLYLGIRCGVAGTLTVPNPLGLASIVRRVRLQANSGIDIFNVTGPGYHYLLRTHQELESDVVPQATNAKSAVTAIASPGVILDMVIPIAINQRDPIGLVMLQSEQTTLTLMIEFESDALVATGATVTATVYPMLELFTVPVNQADWPPLNMVHQCLEDAASIPAAGEFDYIWPRGNTYLQVLHGLGMGVAGADLWTRAQLRINQSDYLLDFVPLTLDMERNYSTLTTRQIGTIPIDLMGSSGLGVYDKTRDTINSALLTDIMTIIQATQASTLYTIRRQLVMLG